MSGNGTSKKKMATKASAASPTITRFFQRPLADLDHRLHYHGQHRRLEAEEDRLDGRETS
jgi:hypothetical protein